MNCSSFSHKSLLGIATATSLLFFSGHALSAPEIIKLTAVDGYPPKALQVQTFIEFFIPEV
nr:hypothetical protein [Rhodospirillales bacterium]